MFDLLDKPLLWIPVKWPGLVQTDDPSAVAVPGEHEVELKVELVDRDEATKLFPMLFARFLAEADREALAAADADTMAEMSFKAFKRLVKDWRKISARGAAVTLNDKNIRLLLRVPMFEDAFAVAYINALAGKNEEREKNSDGSPGDGRAVGTGEVATTTSKKTAPASD